MIRKIFGYKAAKVWAIVASSVTAFVLIVAILASTLFFDTVCSGLGSPLVEKINLGGEPPEYYTAQLTESRADAKQKGNELTEEICEEGFVLLKNGATSSTDDDILPVATSASKKAKVSVFGKNSADLVYSGTGSGKTDGKNAKTIYESLEAANFEVNPSLKSFYESSKSGSGRPSDPDLTVAVTPGFETGETPVSSYDDSLRSTFASYSDLAIVVISRIGGENKDMPMSMKKSYDANASKVNGAASADDHYLELDQNEQDMLQMVCESFDKVVLVINSSNVMELGFLTDPQAYLTDTTLNQYDYASKIGAAIWIGGPGESGIMALGRILSGEVNPSGKTADIYPADFTKDPTWNNFSWGGVNNNDAYLNGTKAVDNRFFVDYEEGIYLGYRYYETAHVESEKGNYEGFDYDKAVVFPFGYGLSYTTFEQTIAGVTISDGDTMGANSVVEVSVDVRNSGAVAGKTAVEVYVSQPYKKTENNTAIEKSAVVLAGFTKTDVIPAGETRSYTVTFDAYSLASYDYNDANKNTFKGYELESGDYEIRLQSDSHTLLDSETVRVEQDIRYKTDPVTKTKVENLYDDASDPTQLQTVLSRADFAGTWPQRRTNEQKQLSSELNAQIASTDSLNPLTAESEEVKNADLTVSRKKAESPVKLYELIGDNNEVDYEDERWETILSSLTMSTMTELINVAYFFMPAIDYIGKPATIETDGPAGWTNFMPGTTSELVGGSVAYAAEVVLGSTWNKDLAQKMGEMVGEEGIQGNSVSGMHYTFSGWYGPGVNLHRSPFGGRNYEYFSEDPTLTGLMAAAEVSGAASRGVYAYVKHFAVNEQETSRYGVSTWLTEQSLRELYLKSFEYTVKEGGATGIMSSFNRIGAKWTGGDYRLITTILRNEWGFRGTVITDFVTGNYMNNKQMTYAGGDLFLNNLPYDDWADSSNPVDVYMLKNSMKNILYTVACSNAMNGMGENTKLITHMPVWQVITICVAAAEVVGMLAWGAAVIVKTVRKIRQGEAAAQEKGES